MFSRFFIDRPVFATVISLVIVLVGIVAWWHLPIAQYPEVAPPTVQVTAFYPGANARTVQDTVAAPIEAQVSGVEGMVYMSSRCTNDGAYNLTVTFKMGMDSDMAQVLVQNRVNLAAPIIPPIVQNGVINVQKMSPNTLMIVNLVSPDLSKDAVFLSNYATIHVKDELKRVKGVAGITYLGQRDYSLRAWLDPDKLAALNLSGMDVVAAIAEQNVQVAAGQIGQPPTMRAQQFQLTINTQGRLTDPQEFANIIIKAGRSVAGQPLQPLSSLLSQGGPGRGGPNRQATGIVYLRDVVRENKYYVRIRLDVSKLAQRKLKTADVIAALSPVPLSISTDPEADPTDNGSLSLLATFGGRQRPHVDELADAMIPLGDDAKSFVRLSEVVTPRTLPSEGGDKAGGIEHLQAMDELGVHIGSQQYDQSCTLDGKPSVALSIYALPGSNALETARDVHAKMKELKARFPDGVEYKIVYDTTPFIQESVDEVYKTLLDAVILVAIVVLFFLQDWRAMILPIIDVPVSLIGTFAVMAAMGFTLNNLTLFGLVLAIGIVVDDAIVVLENIERQIATGLDARTATIKAMDEITGPVLAITLVLSAVFIPCCFLGGITGQFFRQFAVTIAVSTIISAINAITMTPSRAVLIFKTKLVRGGVVSGESSGRTTHHSPLTTHQIKREALPWWIFGLLGFLTLSLSPRLLVSWSPGLAPAQDVLDELPPWQYWAIKGAYFAPGLFVGLMLGWIIIVPVNAVLGWVFRAFNRGFDWMTEIYGVAVAKSLRISVIVFIAYGGLLVLTGVQFFRAPTGFIPQQDKGYLILNVQLPDAASVDRTEKVMAQIEKIVRGDKSDKERIPGIAGVANTVGVSGQSLILNANAPNLGSMYIMLKPFNQRHAADLSADAIAARVLERCEREVNDAIVSVFGGPPVDGLGTTGGFKLMVEDRGNLGQKELQRICDRIVDRANKTEGLTGVSHSSRANTPWLYLEIDRDICEVLGVPVKDVFDTLQVYLGSYYVNNFNAFGRTWQVNVQADQKFRTKVTDIGQLQVRNKQGQMVRLGTFIDVRDTVGPVMLMNYNMYASTAITGNSVPGTSSGQAIEMMQRIASEEMPRSMASEWTELTYLQLQAGNIAMFFFALAVMFVFLVLAAQYESWSLPLAVILVVPMCLLCSVTGVVLASLEVNLFTQIGFVVLVGLASKNAILIVEFAKQRREQGIGIREATVEACRLRLRPILMTSFAFILGVVPLVVARGAGHEMRQSLGLTVFAGMCGVTLFGIFLTPVFYFVIQRFTPK